MGATDIQLPEQPDYAAMQEADRRYRQESEERQMAMMNEMEEKRLEREAAEVRRQERVRENEQSALQQLESSITEQSEAMQKLEKEKDKDIVMDFYNSLAAGQGQGKRPD